MKTELVNQPDCVTVPVNGNGLLTFRRNLVRDHVNKAGVRMLEYTYWKVFARNQTYKITDPHEHARIMRAINDPDVRFVAIGADYVNISTIEAVSEIVGYSKEETHEEKKENIQDNH